MADQPWLIRQAFHEMEAQENERGDVIVNNVDFTFHTTRCNVTC